MEPVRINTGVVVSRPGGWSRLLHPHVTAVHLLTRAEGILILHDETNRSSDGPFMYRNKSLMIPT
jgi:hypothetical protein